MWVVDFFSRRFSSYKLQAAAFCPRRYRRLGRTAEARASYEKALALTQQEAERQVRQERFEELKQNSSRNLRAKRNGPALAGP